MSGSLVEDRWPLPIARACRNFIEAEERKEAHDRAFAVFEVLVKYVATLFISDYVWGSARDHRVNAALKGLARPSLGEWVGFLRELIRFEEGDDRPPRGYLRDLSAKLVAKDARSEFLALHAALTSLIERRPSRSTSASLLSLFNLLVRYRNWGLGHGAPLAIETYRSLSEVFAAALRAVPECLGCVADLPLVLVEEGVTGGPAAYPAMGTCCPTSAAPLDLPASIAGAAKAGRLYVHAEGNLRPCHPLMIYHRDDVYLLNSGVAERNLRVEYLSYSTGDHQIPTDIEEEQRHLLGVILGYDVTADELTRIVTSLGEHIPSAVRERDDGMVLGDYIIVKELGRGGFGTVHEAHQNSLGRRVALKVLPRGADPRMVARFERESRAMARLTHPNIVPVYEIGEADGTHFFSMELIEGPTLAGILSERRAEHPAQTGSGRMRHEDLALWVARFREVARALHYAHGLGMVHRDVKPSNLMLDPSGRLMLLDFGLVQDLSEATLTFSSERLGTLRYMSPEQIVRAKVDHRADVWSLGATLYEFLTGRPAFEGKSEFEIESAIARDDPIRPRRLSRHLSHDLETIVLKALEKDPERRYATAADLADDLDRFLRYEPIRAEPPGAIRRAAKYAMRHKVAAVALAVAALAALGAIGASWYRSERRFREGLADARAAIDAGDVEGARKSLAFLEQGYGARPALRGLADALSERLRAQGLAEWEGFLASRRSADALEATWKERVAQHEPWQPVWERRGELEAWDDVLRVREGIQEQYEESVRSLARAVEAASPRSRAREEAQRALEMIYWERYQEALRSGHVTLEPGFFLNQVEEIGLGTYEAEIEGRGRVSLRTTPPGADVYCFRYESIEARLIPVPFNPRGGTRSVAERLLAGPSLEVERIWEPGGCPFEPGDRFLEVRGIGVGTRSDLAKVLADARADDAVEVKVLRRGEPVPLSWVPFPRKNAAKEGSPQVPGRIVRIRDQFGLTFAGYPLEFLEGARVGTTGADAPLSVELPKGSYLFVLRKEGYRDVRFPVALPHRDQEETVRLLREEEIPPGFVHVPAGRVRYGGDPGASRSLERGETRVEGFFVGRFEVTVGEWLAFVNDPEIGIDDQGMVVHRADWETDEIRPVKPSDERICLIPQSPEGAFYFARDRVSRTWAAPAQWLPEWPIIGISMLAGLEYARWYTERQARSGTRRWRFRLPTDLEWEKAARGADLRIYVWGDYPIWSYCRCAKACYRGEKPLPDPVGAFPFDESVFGVRDMAGSAYEHTTGRTDPPYRYTALRGGNWRTTEDQYFRIANRNGRLPENPYVDTGLRLAADLPPEK